MGAGYRVARTAGGVFPETEAVVLLNLSITVLGLFGMVFSVLLFEINEF